MSPRVLIVDDEESIRFILLRALRHEGYILDSAANGKEAIQKLRQQNYDIMLLDLHMEPVDGMAVFEAAREIDKNLMVIILTAHGALETSLKALRLNAFDYLLKPSSPNIIRQRVRESLEKRQQRRKQEQLVKQIQDLKQIWDTLDEPESAPDEAPPPAHLQHAGPLVMDKHQQTAIFMGESVELTTTEYNLLWCLVDHSPEPVSPRQLILEAMGYDSEEYEAREIVKFHIHKLRQKLEPQPNKPRYIKTIRYKGYAWASQ